MSLHRQDFETPDSIYPRTMRSHGFPNINSPGTTFYKGNSKGEHGGASGGRIENMAWEKEEKGQRGTASTHSSESTSSPTSIPTLLSPNPTCLLRTALHAQLQRTPLIASFPSAFFGYALPPGSIRISIFPETLDIHLFWIYSFRISHSFFALCKRRCHCVEPGKNSQQVL